MIPPRPLTPQTKAKPRPSAARRRAIATAAFCASCALASLAVEALAKDPQWIETGAHRDYPPASHALAVGEGASAEEADKLALLGLASQLRVDIQGRSQFTRRSQTLADGATTREQDVEVTLTSSVKIEDLEGAHIVARHRDRNGARYALAALNLREAAQSATQRIDKLRNKVTRKLQARGDGPDQALRGAVEASAELPQIQTLLERLRLFARADQFDPVAQRAAATERAVARQLREASRGVSLAAASPAQLTRPASQALASALEIELRRNDRPLANIPLRARAAPGVEASVSPRSDSRGRARLTLQRIPYTGESETAVEAALDVPDSMQGPELPRLAMTLLLPQKSRVTVAVTSVSRDFDGDLDLLLRETLADLLAADSYAVTKSGAAQVVVEAALRLRLKEGRGPIKFAALDGAIRLFDGRGGRPLSSLLVPKNLGKQGALTHREAARKLIAKLAREMRGPLLARLEEHLSEVGGDGR